MSRLALTFAVLPLLPACADDATGTGTDGGSSTGDPTSAGTDPTAASGVTSGSGTSAGTTGPSVDGTDASGTSGTSGGPTAGSETSDGESSGETGTPPTCTPLRGDGTATAAARIGDATPQVVASLEQVVALAPIDGATMLVADVGDVEISVDPLDPLPAASGITNLRGVLARLDDTGDFAWTHLLESTQIGAATPFVNLTDMDTDGARTSFIGVFRGTLELDGVEVTDCLNRCALFGWVEPDGTLDDPFVIQPGAVVDAPIITSVATRPDGGMVMGGAASGSVSFGGAVLNNTPIEEDVNIGVFDAEGQHVWSRRWGGEGEERVGGLADLDCDVLVAATTSGVLDFGGDALGGDGISGPDLVVARLAGDDGEHVWSVDFSASGGSSTGYTRVATQDGLVIVSHTAGEQVLWIDGRGVSGGGFVIALDAETGQVQWHRAFDGIMTIRGLDTRCDAIAISGTYNAPFTYDGTSAPPSAGQDAFVARLSLDDGALAWLQTVSDSTQGNDNQQATAVAFGPDDALWLGGLFVGDINPGTGLLQSGLGGPGADGFTIRLEP